MEPARPLLKEITNEEVQSAPPKKGIKDFIIYGSLAIAFGTAASLMYLWFIYSASHISTDNAFIDSELYPVSCRIMGYVKEILVNENEEVKKGQILALLDDTDFKVELSFKKAKLSKAQSDMKRATSLLKTKAISQADFELAEANLIANQADYDGTMLKLKYTQITSPVDGIVGKRTLEPGQFVQPGQGLYVVISQNNLWVKANYKETQLGKIKVGQKVEIKVDAFPQLRLFGHIQSIFPSSGSRLSILPPENATGNFTKVVQRIPVKIVFDAKSNRYLKSGMSVTSTVLINE